MQMMVKAVILFGRSDLDNIFNKAAVAENTPSSLTKTMEVFFKNVYTEISIQNNANASCRVQIWWCMAKRTGALSYGGKGISDLKALVSDGLAAGGSAGTFDTYGVRPTASLAFNQYWRVKKVTYTDLAAGQTHYERFTYAINRSLNRQALEVDMQALRGWTVVPLIVHYGMPVPALGPNVASISPSSLNLVSYVQYRYAWMQKNVTTNAVDTNLSASVESFENLVTSVPTIWGAAG